MKKAILCSLMAMTIAFAPAAHATGAKPGYPEHAEQSRTRRELSTSEKLVLINGARAEVRALRQELSMAQSRYFNDQLVYDISLAGGIVSGAAAVVASVSALFSPATAGRATWVALIGGNLLMLAATLVKESAKDRMTITELQMNRLKEELIALEHRLEGFEAGYRTMLVE